MEKFFVKYSVGSCLPESAVPGYCESEFTHEWTWLIFLSPKKFMNVSERGSLFEQMNVSERGSWKTWTFPPLVASKNSLVEECNNLWTLFGTLKSFEIALNTMVVETILSVLLFSCDKRYFYERKKWTPTVLHMASGPSKRLRNCDISS